MTFPGQRQLREVFGSVSQMIVFDHFQYPDSLSRWNTLEGDADGDVTLDTDDRAGVLKINAGVSLDEEAYVFSSPVFSFKGDLPMLARGRMVGDADTANGYSWCFGFSNVFGTADKIVNGGAALAADFEGCLFFKPYNTNKISVVTSVGSSTDHTYEVTQFTQASDPPASDFVFLNLEIQVDPKADDFFEITYRLSERNDNGLQVCLSEDTNRPIKHYIRYAPTNPIYLGAGLKNGVAAEASILKIDYLGGVHQSYRD